VAKKAVKKSARGAPTRARLKNMVTTPRQKILTPGLSATVVRAARNAVSIINEECGIISMKYNDTAIRTGTDARKAFAKAEVDKDRATLESLFAKEYNFVDPFGVVGTRDSTIEAILSGKIRKDSFRTVAEALQIHDKGSTIVSTGKFNMKGSVKVRFKSTGAVRDRDISGTYLTTHTYVKRDGRLQLASSQLTLQPSPKEFTHGPGEK
jgi:Domain of unknown function (DUF4440)